ncbi:hypothetical protein Daesc_005860 [Daldinia eschscholtzii]|uniref:Oxidoreductase acuF-like C2H2 type zinc-finger domain-containing protein n=1 Tax=Daldinia eschscholtzii TaxID=292717 RepID=A0AAX6MLN8_9PEZI
MPERKQGVNILERSHDVKRSLESLKSGIENEVQRDHLLLNPDEIGDILDRFLLWAGNLGVFNSPASEPSLESRLSMIPEVENQIGDLLNDLLEVMDELKDKLANQPDQMIPTNSRDGISHSFSGDSLYDETHTIIEVMSLHIGSLFRMSILVQRELPKARQGFRDWDLDQAVLDVKYVERRFTKLSRPNTRWLAERIGIANAKRRWQIRYFHDHKARRGVDINKAAAELSDEAKTAELNAAQGKDKGPLKNISQTFEWSESLRLPSLGLLSSDETPFECPICSTDQSFQTEEDWVLHALSDLKAKQIGDRAATESHISSIHGAFKVEQVKALVDTGRVIPTYFEDHDCPFCDGWVDSLGFQEDTGDKSLIEEDGKLLVSRSQFAKHIATHQELIATSVLPLPTRFLPQPTGRSIQAESSTTHSTAHPVVTTSIPSEGGNDGNLTRSRTRMAPSPRTLRADNQGKYGRSRLKPADTTNWRWTCCACHSVGRAEVDRYDPNL